jgi:hypothetical protein
MFGLMVRLSALDAGAASAVGDPAEVAASLRQEAAAATTLAEHSRRRNRSSGLA